MWKRLLAAFVVVIAGSSGNASAQRKEVPRVPRAVTDAQLQRWCDALGVSDEQRHSIELEFEQYLDDFEPLRLEMADAAIKHPESSRTDLELVRQLPAFIERTRAADELLFARVDPLLTEDQRLAMPRIRMQRERSLVCGLRAVNHIIGDGVPDLRALLESLDPSPEVLNSLRPALDDYESRLTMSLRVTFGSLMHLCATEAPNQWYSHASSNTPMDPAMQADIDRVVDDVRELRAMNRRFFESTAPMLPDELRRRWRNEFVLHAYGSARDSGRVWVLGVLDQALKTELPEDQRQAVLNLREQARNAESEILARLMTVLDAEAVRPAGPGGARGSDELMQSLNSAREEAMSRSMEFRKSLIELLGENRVKELSGQPSGKDDARYAQDGWRAAYGLVSFVSRVGTRGPSVPALRTEPLIPWPMARDEFELWLDSFNVSDDHRAAIHTMYADYTKALESALKPLQEAAVRNSSHVMMRDKPEDPLERARAAEKTRAEMLAVVDAADAAFSQRLRDAIDEGVEQTMWDRVLRLRQRTLLGVDQSWASNDAANVSGGIDLVHLLLQQKLTSDEWALLAESVAEYEAELDSLLRQQRDSIARSTYEMTARRDGWQPEGGWFEDDDGQHERYRKIGHLNRATVQTMVAALPPEHGALVADAFNRRAYPKAFDDPGNMDAALRQALQLTDLTPEQREGVITARANFDEAYFEAREQMIQLCAAAPQYMPMAGRRVTEDVARGEERFNENWARAIDVRDEANRRALRGLRVTLLPAQMRRLTLPETE